mgnify:CR=1 FL=1|jgi:hypothetical protein
MCTYDDLVAHIAGCRVNDEFSQGKGDWKVWKENVIRKVLRESLSSIFALRPDLFATNKEVTLKECACIQCFCEDCCRVVGVISVDGQSCNIIENKDDEQDNFSLDFLGCYFPDCETPDCFHGEGPLDGYNPGWWDQIETSPCCIRFQYPPPRAGIKAIIACVPNNVLDGPELPCAVCGELFQALVDNALFRLYSIDHKDGVMPKLAEAHWQAYLTTMTTKFMVDYSLLEDDFLLTKRRINGD